MAMRVVSQPLATVGRTLTSTPLPRLLTVSAARTAFRGSPVRQTPPTQRAALHTSAKRSGRSVVAMAGAQTIYDFSVKDIDGKSIDMSKYKGKVLLVVNVASECGFTKQYAGLAELHDKYRNKGFEVLAFPCNQFGSQEPGSNDQIKSFAKTKGASFQMFDKIDVNGDNADPLWQNLKSQQGLDQSSIDQHPPLAACITASEFDYKRLS